MTTKFKVQHIADSHIHHAQKSLIPPLELALVEYLNSNNRRILDRSRVWKRLVIEWEVELSSHISKLSFQ